MPGFGTTLRAAALILAIASPAFAQTTSPRSDTTGRSLFFRAGGGLNVGGQPFNSSNAVIGIDWQRPSSRFGLRLAGSFSRRATDYFRPFANPVCDQSLCVTATRTDLYGVTLDGRVDLMETRLRPYLVSGIGLFQVTRTDQANVECAGGQCVFTPNKYDPMRWGTAETIGLHAGFGFAYTLGRSQLFTEVRVQTLNTWGYRPSQYPLTFGFRF